MSDNPILNLRDKLYYKLPNQYRTDDATMLPTPYPLKRFLNVVGEGSSFIEDKLKQYDSMFDPVTCPAELLDYLAYMLGMKFPVEVTEIEKRRLITTLSNIIKYKGTISSFEFLARETYNPDTSVNAYKVPYEAGMTPQQYRKIIVDITTLGESLDIIEGQNKFFKLVEFIRPVNYAVVANYSFFYVDAFSMRDNLEDSYMQTTIKETENPNYKSILNNDELFQSTLLDIETDNRYNVSSYDGFSTLYGGEENVYLADNFVLSTTPTRSDKITCIPDLETATALVDSYDTTFITEQPLTYTLLSRPTNDYYANYTNNYLDAYTNQEMVNGEVAINFMNIEDLYSNTVGTRTVTETVLNSTTKVLSSTFLLSDASLTLNYLY